MLHAPPPHDTNNIVNWLIVPTFLFNKFKKKKNKIYIYLVRFVVNIKTAYAKI